MCLSECTVYVCKRYNKLVILINSKGTFATDVGSDVYLAVLKEFLFTKFLIKDACLIFLICLFYHLTFFNNYNKTVFCKPSYFMSFLSLYLGDKKRNYYKNTICIKCFYQKLQQNNQKCSHHNSSSSSENKSSNDSNNS